MPKEKLYTLDELATTLRVSKQTIYNRMKRGKYNFTRFGREYLVTEAQLNEILATGQNVSK